MFVRYLPMVTDLNHINTYFILYFFLQEEERRKREELEQIMAENNRKIEEAQKKLVSVSISGIIYGVGYTWWAIFSLNVVLAE